MGVFIYFIYFQLFVGMPDEIILPLWLHTKKWYCPATQPSLNSRFLVFWWNTAARDLSSSGGLLWLTMNLHQWMMWLMIDLHWGTFKMRIYVFISIIFLGEWIIRGTNVCHTFSPGGGDTLTLKGISIGDFQILINRPPHKLQHTFWGARYGNRSLYPNIGFTNPLQSTLPILKTMWPEEWEKGYISKIQQHWKIQLHFENKYKLNIFHIIQRCRSIFNNNGLLSTNVKIAAQNAPPCTTADITDLWRFCNVNTATFLALRPSKF